MEVKNKLSLDADHQGHLLCVICDYLNHIRLNIEDYLESDDTDSRVEQPAKLMELFYFAGNVEGRLLSNNITTQDLELIEEWEKELEGFEAEDKDVDEEDFTLVFSSHAPVEYIHKTTFLTARIRRNIRYFFPNCEPNVAWLTEDAEEYGCIQLILQILVSPKYKDKMTAAVKTALGCITMSVDDMWEEQA